MSSRAYDQCARLCIPRQKQRPGGRCSVGSSCKSWPALCYHLDRCSLSSRAVVCDFVAISLYMH